MASHYSSTLKKRLIHSIKTLELFNFGPQIQRWIKTFYNNCSSCVMNNGYASEFFKIQGGVRQGCALSGAFFVLCSGLEINKSKNEGMWLGASRNKKTKHFDIRHGPLNRSTHLELIFRMMKKFLIKRILNKSLLP